MTRARGWLLILVLLTPAVVLPLWVSLYDSEDPRLGGFPFFFWFQFLLIGVAVVLTVAAYVVGNRVAKLDRVAHGLAPEPPPIAGERDGSADR